MIQTYIADYLFDGNQILKQVPLTVEEGRVVSLDFVPNVSVTRLEGMIVPGYIDVQVNGGGGMLFNDNPSAEIINHIFMAHAVFGTTGFLPTLITDDMDKMQQAADAISTARQKNAAAILGVHFEGPHLSVRKKGVHRADYIRHISDREMEIYTRKDIGICHITIAPENVAPEVIENLTAQGVIISLGHSDASFEITQRALKAGARGFTHLFNAMSALEGRAPGMVGAALLCDESWCGIIVDGYHLHDMTAKIAIKAKGKDKMMLVTDAMSPVGTSDEEFELMGQKVTHKAGKLTVASGRLAGSALDMASAVRNVVKNLGLPPEDAFQMASSVPANFLKLEDELGQLKSGKKANFILLNEALEVQASFVEGQKIY